MTMKAIQVLSLVALLFVAACDQSDFSDNSGEDLFFLEQAQAIMPVRVMGNKASNRFVIFLHGGPGGNIVDARDFLGRAFTPIEEVAAMVYWDQRCAGASQGNCDNQKLSFEAYNSDLNALIQVLQYQYGSDVEFYLLTHSFGGWFAADYLSSSVNHAKIRAWINMDGAHNAPLLFKESLKMMREVGHRQISLGSQVKAWTELIEEAEAADLDTFDGKVTLNSAGYLAANLMTEADSVNTYPADKIKLSTLLTSQGSPFANLMNNASTEGSPFNEALFSMDHSDKLQDITLPVLLLWGKYDFVVPPAMIEDFEAHIGSGEVEAVLFERSEHTPMVSEPEAFADAVVSFLRRH